MLIVSADAAGDFDPTGFVEGAVVVCGAIFLIFSLIALMGAIMAITGKSWGLAIVGGIFGLLCIGFVGTGSLFGLIGLILIAISKDEFGEQPPPGAMYPPPAGYPPQQAPPAYPQPEQAPPPGMPPEQPPMGQPPMEQPPAEPAPMEPPKEPEY
jgi:hypothetical protein